MTAAAKKFDKLVSRFRTAFEPERIRTFVEFAEEEISLPDGPRMNLRYKTSFMPFSRFILDEFHHGKYQEFWGSGPVQASKTLHFFVIPALYHLFEIGEHIILGAPTVAMAKGAYLQRILPVIRKNAKFFDFLPTMGGGSRGGVADLIQFKNGATLRFVGAGGGDKQVRSYTARVVIITEVDAMDEAGKESKESDPVTKMIARTESFGDRARVYAECTMTNPQGRIWRQVTQLGTDSRVFLRCPHCHEWIWPERSSFVGWQDTPDEITARKKATFVCPRKECGAAWTEEDRRAAMREPRVVAKSQTVTSDGTVVGDLPPTTVFGFRWNSMASPLTSLSKIAAQEWKAAQSGIDEDEKGVTQHVWAEPWEKKTDLVRPDMDAVLRKIVNLERGAIPREHDVLTLGIDLGSYTIPWALMSWGAEARGHVVDFGILDVPVARGEKDPIKILNTLREFREKSITPGWNGRQPDLVLIDAGYEQQVVYDFVLESGEPQYLAARGQGTNSQFGQWTQGAASEATEVREVGNQYRITLQPAGARLVIVHDDHWKAAVQDGFFAKGAAAGSITIFHGDGQRDTHLRQFARQIVAEERQYVERPGKAPKLVWVLKSKQNHFLDTTKLARCAAEMLGIRMVEDRVETQSPRLLPTMRRIRSKY